MLTYQVSLHFIRLPKGSTLFELIEDIKSKVNLLQELLIFFQVLWVHNNLILYSSFVPFIRLSCLVVILNSGYLRSTIIGYARYFSFNSYITMEDILPLLSYS